MISRGGRGARGLSVAVAIALLLVPAFVAPASFLSPVSVGHAQAVTDPWWGPSDRSAPTKGWAVRVPIVVSNDDPIESMSNRVVAVDLDLGQLLVEAGWTNETKGADVRPRGFTLDVDSLRVVEYTPGFSQGPLEGPNAKPLPHQFYPAMWRATRHQEFDARDPAGTVTFLMPGALAAKAKRYFYLYANPLEYGDLPPATFTLQERAPLDAYLWASQGTTVYGYEPGGQTGQQHMLHIGSMSNQKATVTVYELAPGSGRFTPLTSTAAFQNPFTLPPFQIKDVFVQGGRPFKIVSERPILVYATGTPVLSTSTDGSAAQPTTTTTRVDETFGYVPALNGTFAGRSFSVYGWRGDGPQAGTGLAWAIAAKPKAITVTANAFAGGPSVTLTPSNPVQPLALPTGQWSFVSATDDVLLTLTPPTLGVSQPQQTVQIPALSGGPTGVDFFSPLTPDRGLVRACADENSSVRIVSMGSGRDSQLFPQGTVETANPYVVTKGRFCDSFEAPLGTPADQWEFYAEDRYPTPHAPVPFRLYTGAPERGVPQVERGSMGYYGGAGATDFIVHGATGLFGHFNNTRVTIHEEKEERLANGTRASTNRTITLSQDQFFAITPATTATGSAKATGTMRIVSQKPITVVSLDEVAIYQDKDGKLERTGQSHDYFAYVPGRPDDVPVTVGRLEYRGPLVDLRSPETSGRLLSLSTGPATPATFRLDAVNLGRWLAGESLPDSITVKCTGPAGWKVEGCDRTIDLQSGAAERLGIVVTPAADEIDATKYIDVEATSKTPGVVSRFRLAVIVEVRYGVGLWIGAVGGEKKVDPPVGLDPRGAHTYRIWIKNLGSTRDNFTLTLDDAREGWTQTLTIDGEPRTRIALDGGEAKEMLLRVVAPDAETAPANDVTLTAVSETSANAGDQVNTVTRIRPKVNVKMTVDPQTQLAEPGQATQFNVTLDNSGNDVFRVVIRQESTRAWPATLERDDVYINPGDALTLKLRVTPPADARAGDLASVKLTADVYTGGATSVVGDQVSAVTVVRRVHNLTIPAAPEAQAEPGATLRYVLPVQNLGNGQDVVELLPLAVTANWTVAFETPSVTIPYNETGELALVIGVPPGLPADTYNLTFTTRLSREAFQNLTVPVQVARVARVAFDGATDLRTTPGRPTPVALVARNAGNVAGTYVLDADAPPSWNVTFSPDRVRLEPGQSIPVTLMVNASRDALDGTAAVGLLAQHESAPAGETPIRVTLARPQLAITDVDAQGRLTRGELVVVAATVRNSGAIAAENVSVALLVDGKVVDRTTLLRVPVNATAVATLSWVATSGGGDVQVVLDPEQEIVQVSRDQNVASVSFGSRVPSVGLVAVLAVALGLALARRRRA